MGKSLITASPSVVLDEACLVCGLSAPFRIRNRADGTVRAWCRAHLGQEWRDLYPVSLAQLMEELYLAKLGENTRPAPSGS